REGFCAEGRWRVQTATRIRKRSIRPAARHGRSCPETRRLKARADEGWLRRRFQRRAEPAPSGLREAEASEVPTRLLERVETTWGAGSFDATGPWHKPGLARSA